MLLSALRSSSVTRCGLLSRRYFASKVPQIKDAQFEQEVLQNNLPVLVDFYAAWCGPCKVLSPKLESLAEMKKNQLHVVKVDGEENIDLASKLNVSAYPTVILFNKGKEVDRFIGVRELNNIVTFLEKHIPKSKPQ